MYAHARPFIPTDAQQNNGRCHRPRHPHRPTDRRKNLLKRRPPPNPFGLPRDRHTRRIELIALIIGSLDGRRMKNLVVGVTGYVARRALDYLLAYPEANHPASPLRIPTHRCRVCSHHGLLLARMLHRQVSLLVLSGALAIRSTESGECPNSAVKPEERCRGGPISGQLPSLR